MRNQDVTPHRARFCWAQNLAFDWVLQKLTLHTAAGPASVLLCFRPQRREVFLQNLNKMACLLFRFLNLLIQFLSQLICLHSMFVSSTSLYFPIMCHFFPHTDKLWLGFSHISVSFLLTPSPSWQPFCNFFRHIWGIHSSLVHLSHSHNITVAAAHQQ